MKNVRKTCEFEFAQRMKARNVETPPLRTAGPILVSERDTLWSRVPGVDRNSWVTWAALSTGRYVHQLNSILLTFHNQRLVQKSKRPQSKLRAMRATFTPSAAHLTVSLYFWSSRSNAQSESRALEGRHVSSKSPLRFRDGDEGVAGRNYRE